jgi:hypothetical protein
MIDIIVERGAADKQGEDIVDALITTVEVARLRGRVEIDRQEPVERVVLQARYKPGVRNGDIIEVQDSLFGRTWRGKIISLSHQISQTSVTSTLTVERPQNY